MLLLMTLATETTWQACLSFLNLGCKISFEEETKINFGHSISIQTRGSLFPLCGNELDEMRIGSSLELKILSLK